MDKNLIPNPKSFNHIKGTVGESLANDFLKKNGYEILQTNYKTKLGEIDIIAKDQSGRIIFVEVKARATAKHGYPREAVTREKQQTLRRVAELYLKIKKQQSAFVRFDVVEILADEITHIKNAF